MVICADVIEHVENPYKFLREVRKHADYFLFNIPLDANVLMMIRGKKMILNAYNTVGHLHFYSASSADAILETTGYEVEERKFAKNRTRNLLTYPSLRKTLASIPQLLIETFSPYISAMIMGDSLVVLASRNMERQIIEDED